MGISGKILIINLISIGEADTEGERTLFYELNGMPRESIVTDKALTRTATTTRRKGDPNDPSQVRYPSPGIEVKAGDKLVVIEAMSSKAMSPHSHPTPSRIFPITRI